MSLKRERVERWSASLKLFIFASVIGSIQEGTFEINEVIILVATQMNFFSQNLFELKFYHLKMNFIKHSKLRIMTQFYPNKFVQLPQK
jgi:hypothetical protein